MPVTSEIAASNASQTERLRTFLGQLTPERLGLRLANGWTVAMAFAHIAFWDMQRMCLLQFWWAGNWCYGGYDGELFNEVVQPFLELLPPERVGPLALKTAEQLDALLLEFPDDFVDAVMARPEKPYPDRGTHRGYHLDQIEQVWDGTKEL